MSIYTFLVISHIIGTILGVGGATFAEIHHTRALKDGQIDPKEGKTLKVTYSVIRWGLIIATLSGFGFLLLFRLTGEEERLLDPKLWAKMSIIVVLITNALLLQMHKIPMWLGASISLTSWYGALILGSWRSYPYSYVDTIIGYVIAIVLVAIALHFIKRIYFKK
jgi:hypothetical protein|tara:strand:+ start:17681 stop:18175 length:495 start_codon:yes stop_codon:yes gene_type:complete